ncbi:GldL-related protein [Flavobacterium psychrotrophum]|uniref:GldL-related protein n=1 Tax=Flavobacterium psychrotrophum TaxID=2294119 RepID=UPI0013C45360|nr:gliding motility protein GldL [Flavobacterium psychrotrophum]
MKYKHLIALYLTGTAISIIGALFKLMHWPYASIMLGVSTALQVVVVVGAIIKVLNDNDAKSFLNR